MKWTESCAIPHPMAASATGSERSEKELFEATKEFAKENRVVSWLYVAQTIGVIAACIVATVVLKNPFARGAFSVVAGLTLVRLFILFHDYQHAAILKRSQVAKAVLGLCGGLLMTPPKVWRDTHNYHHAHTAKIVGSHVGSYLMVTTDMWKSMTPKERFMYSAIRHPLTIVFAYFTVFMLGMLVSPLRRDPKKYWQNAIALLFNWSMTAFLLWKFGFAMFFFAFFLPLAVSMALGAYLFYAQHNFPEIHVQPRQAWNYTRAALESSSYMKMGGVMNWFTGNIGYHHVHHLNPQVPFYRLPEAMASIPELQHPPTTSLMPKDVIACFRLKLWDNKAGHMVGYAQDEAAPAPAAE